MQENNKKSGLNTFDHVVVLMLENRSFDNLLGYLYEDGVPPGKQFEGLQDKVIEIPVPERAVDYKEHKIVQPHKAKDYHQPYPDPGEVYQHVNTQLYNFINKNNIGVDAGKMAPPYNIPNPQPETPSMNGFVNDYINTLQALDGKEGSKYNNPDFSKYSVIMQCYKPEQVNVLATLAKEFAVFDHWYCSVPSQTWCNRAFWHAGTSGGKVVNPLGEGSAIDSMEAMASWIKHVWDKKTLFHQMAESNISYAVYKGDIVSLTGLIHDPFKIDNPFYDKGTIKRYTDFENDINNGKLPQYSFIEPKFLLEHNDQHPSSVDSTLFGRTKCGTVFLGEKLILDVYNTIKNSDQYRDKTLFIITHDEHGGCFDHVVPHSPVPPPEKGMTGEKGFTFNRLGIRVPMVMVSAYIQKNTIENNIFEHSSFIKTMCDKWGLEGLTERDKKAQSFEAIFSKQKRDFPELEPITIDPTCADESDFPLNELQRSILNAAHYTAKQKQGLTVTQADAVVVANIKTIGEAMAHLESIRIYLK